MSDQLPSDQCYAAGCKQAAMEGSVLCKEHYGKLPAPMRGEQPSSEKKFSPGETVVYSHSPDGWRWFDTTAIVVKQTSENRVTIRFPGHASFKSVSARSLTHNECSQCQSK